VTRGSPLAGTRLPGVAGRTSAGPALRHRAARRRAELLHPDRGGEHSLRELGDPAPNADPACLPADHVNRRACSAARALGKSANTSMVPLLGGVTNVRRARERPQPAGEEATADFPADDPLGRGGWRSSRSSAPWGLHQPLFVLDKYAAAFHRHAIHV
jgi:hypothetical protein